MTSTKTAAPLASPTAAAAAAAADTSAFPELAGLGLQNLILAQKNLQALASYCQPSEYAALWRELQQFLPRLADADMALNNLERLFQRQQHKYSFIYFFQRKPHALYVLLQLLSASQYFSQLIIQKPEYFDFLWEEGHLVLEPQQLHQQMMAEVGQVGVESEAVLRLLRECRQRELLRIGYRDIALGESLENITQSISDLADALVEAALTIAYRRLQSIHGEPRLDDGKVARIAVLAMGKLGGRELNYSSDIDLMAVYEGEGETDGNRRLSNNEFFDKLLQQLVRLLSTNTDAGLAFRVDLRLRPHGSQAALCMSLKNAIAYYEKHGRTWERQALIKCCSVAGSRRLGQEFLRAIEPIIYRQYLTFVQINELKAMKRRIQRHAQQAGYDNTDVKLGYGGIRDIEFVVQFLQLLYGQYRPEVRECNTLRALKKLAEVGCINAEEHTALDEAYRFLRKIEHRLQFMFDLQTHRLPTDAASLRKLALRLEYSEEAPLAPEACFQRDLEAITAKTRVILNRLMLDLFAEDEANGWGEPETDLIFDPNPGKERIAEVLGKYNFKHVSTAYHNLTQLAEENVPFLSSERCRHFFANLAPRLLQAISQTADPDMALNNLEKVTASLGAKGVLWESLSLNSMMLHIYVHLCSSSQFLAEILIRNPGMIDELLDYLADHELPDLKQCHEDLRSLIKGARHLEPILHSFRNTHLLQIGISDLLGKARLHRITQSLSDLAEAILGTAADLVWEQQIQQLGQPSALARKRQQPVDYVLLALGKFGGRELNYHSDLDLMLIYEKEGQTLAIPTCSNFLFYTQFAQKLSQTMSQVGPLGKLYSIDWRLRPEGKSADLVLSYDRFREYYEARGPADLWERLSLLRARIVHGSAALGKKIMTMLQQTHQRWRWQPQYVEDVRQMRHYLEASRQKTNFKRGAGGIVDVEFAVQLFMLRYSAQHPEIIRANVWQCLDMIEKCDLWPSRRIRIFYDGYTFLRMLENRLRIVYNIAKEELPTADDELKKLALRMGYEGKLAREQLLADLEHHTKAIRQEYDAWLNELAQGK